MAKSISRNYLYNVSYQLLTLLTPFITTPYLSRVLGPDGIGIYSYTTSIVSYFILFSTLGLRFPSASAFGHIGYYPACCGQTVK